MKPLISIVTINYNQAEVTCACLETLRHLTYPNVEVVVVDNASEPEDKQIIKDRFPEFQLVENEANEGFTGGNNAGIRLTKGTFIMLLNNDTEVPPDFLEPLIQPMLNDPTIGITSPTIVFHHTPGMIQYSGSTPINPYTARSQNINFGRYENEVELESGLTHLGHGAALMVKREVFEKIGLLSDLFFIYYEEYDFCERAKREGYKIKYVAESKVYHKESITTGKKSPFKTYYMTRNRLLFVRRNVEGMALYVCMFYILMAAIPKNTFGHLFSRRFDLLKAFWRGLGWHFESRDITVNPMLSAG